MVRVSGLGSKVDRHDWGGEGVVTGRNYLRYLAKFSGGIIWKDSDHSKRILKEGTQEFTLKIVTDLSGKYLHNAVVITDL